MKHRTQMIVNIYFKSPSRNFLSKKPKVISSTTKFLLNKTRNKIKKIIKNNLEFGFKLYLSSYKPKKKKNEATKVNPNKCRENMLYSFYKSYCAQQISKNEFY